MATISELLQLRSKIDSQIYKIKNDIIFENTPKFLEECLNLYYCVGKNYIEGDYFAPSRYYSTIDGIKNIRFDLISERNEYGELKLFNAIQVKLLNPKGEFLPNSIKLKDREYKIYFEYSKNYTSKVNY